MAMSAQELVRLACEQSRMVGHIRQAGILLNQILRELTQEYDLAVALQTTTLTISGSGANNGAGPYSLPSNYFRMASRDATYLISGVPYVLIQITLAQFDALINNTGVSSFPNLFATDVSTSPASFFVYPPPSMSFSLKLRYYGGITDIVAPETSVVVPWFPAENYLLTRLSGEMMRVAGDARADSYLGDGPQGAVGILRRWLNLQGDREDTATMIQLDRRFFGVGGGSTFAPSKITGGV